MEADQALSSSVGGGRARAPISDGQSGFRTSGRSFVRPLCYLRRVAPAVWRELNPAETVSRTASAQPGNP